MHTLHYTYSDFSLIVHPINSPYPLIIHLDFQVPKYNDKSATVAVVSQKVKDQILSYSGDTKCKRLVKYSAIEEKVVAFISLLRNRTKPLPVTLSTVKEYAEQVAKTLGEKDFCASSGWWEKLRKRNNIGRSVQLHGEAVKLIMSKSRRGFLKYKRF